MASAKEELRGRLLRQRGALAPRERSAIDDAIARHVLSLPEFHDARVVLCYLSMDSEVETRDVIEASWRAGKVVALPRVMGAHSMRWYRVDGPDGLAALERSPFGVLEPVADSAREVAPDAVTLVLVPGLAFDRVGQRLGYGGGFYDVFLADFVGPSIGLCRSAALIETLPCTEPHDLPVQKVVTERGVVGA